MAPRVSCLASFSSGITKPAAKSKINTCDTCRERKVRCDKQQPCERCRRLNLNCTYAVSKGASVDVSETLQLLHKRLAQAEAAIAACKKDEERAASDSESRQRQHGIQATGQLGSGNPLPLFWDPDFGLPSVEEDLMGVDLGGLADFNLPYVHGGPVDPLHLQSTNSDSGDILNADLEISSSLVSPTVLPRSRQPLSLCSASNTSTLSHGQDIVHLLHQRFFEAQKNIPAVIYRSRFYRQLQEHPDRHHANAICQAVAMCGAALSRDFPHLEGLCYTACRYHVDQAEQLVDNRDFFSIEILQALILVVRNEFMEGTGAGRAWMTMGRTVRLMRAIGLDKIDADSIQPDYDSVQVPLDSTQCPLEMEERRRTFWVTFHMDFFFAALTKTQPTLDVSEIYTFLPYAEICDTTAGPSQFLKDLDMSATYPVSVFTPLIIATAIGSKALKHIRLSNKHNRKIGAPEYDFWTHHFELDLSVKNCLSYSPFTPGVEDGPSTDSPLCATTHLTLLGITIALHRAALERGDASGMTADSSVMAESKYKVYKVAEEIAMALASKGPFANMNVRICNLFHLYILWPISLALEVQVERLKELTSVEPPAQTEHYIIVDSLRDLEAALRKFKSKSMHFDDLLADLEATTAPYADYGVPSATSDFLRDANYNSSVDLNEAAFGIVC